MTSLYAAKRETDRADERTRSNATPCRITKVNKSTVNVTPLMAQLVYQDGERADAQPLEFEDVRYGGFGGGESYIHIPPIVGMIGFLIVTDFDVGDIDQGAVIVDKLAGRSSGYFIPMMHSDYLEHIEIYYKGSKIEITDGDITLTPASGTVKIIGDIDVSGSAKVGDTLTAAVDVVAGGISTKTHVHRIISPIPQSPVTPPVG